MSGPRTPTSADGADPSSEQLSTHRFLTAPNLFTLLRLCCIPIFCWLLFGKDDQVAAAWLLGRDAATLAGPDTRTQALAILTNTTACERLINDMARTSGDGAIDPLRRLLDQFVSGFLALA